MGRKGAGRRRERLGTEGRVGGTRCEREGREEGVLAHTCAGTCSRVPRQQDPREWLLLFIYT